MEDFQIPLVRDWPRRVRPALIQVIAMARTAIMAPLCDAENSPLVRMQLKGELTRANQIISRHKCQIEILRRRMSLIPAPQRPRYIPEDRLRIIEQRTAFGWSIAETARQFQVEPETISNWMNQLGLDCSDHDSLLAIAEPVNRFPDYVRFLVSRLQVLLPTLGVPRIAEILARAGLHLAPTTISPVYSRVSRSVNSKAVGKPGQAIFAAISRTVALTRPF